MSADVLAWKLGKLLLALGLFLGVCYFSLVKRVEREKGSWEAWLKEAPVLEGEKGGEPKKPGEPRNLKARFWTGIPRSRNPDVARVDHYGYSSGVVKKTGGVVWEAFYLPAGTSTKTPEKKPGLWKDDGGVGGRVAEELPWGWEWVQIVPGGLMVNAYGWGDDAWKTSNRTMMRKGFPAEIWAPLMKLFQEYAVVHGGVVVFAGPVREGGGEPTAFYAIVLKSSPRGPEVLCLLIPSGAKQRGELEFARYLVPVSTVEQATGLVFFADLPAEWRNYLLSKPQRTMWPK